MPFTPAHTAIVLPLIHARFLSATGLVIGAMTPDFEYFFKMSVNGVHSHTWAGLFYFDLPVTIGLAFLFHDVVKHNLFANLPDFLRSRFAELVLFNFNNGFRTRPFTFIFSALLGSLTHILWDGFTHGDGLFVKRLAFYDGSYVPFEGVNYPLWYALQHISTFVGLFFVLISILAKKQRYLPASRINPLYWLCFLLIGGATLWIRFLLFPEDYNLGNLVVSSISAICLSLVLCGLIKFPSLKDQTV